VAGGEQGEGDARGGGVTRRRSAAVRGAGGTPGRREQPCAGGDGPWELQEAEGDVRTLP